MDDTTRTPRWLFVATLLFILLVAAGLRLYRLSDLPLGIHYDEAANVILAGEIASGLETPIFIPSYTGKEVLFFYWTALWMKLLGATPVAMRLSAALVGVATVAAAWWAVRELLYEYRGVRWVALLTAAFLATSFWHLILSRYGFRAVTQPLMQALTVAALWRGLRLDKGKAIRWFILAGVFCGLTAYTYLAARAFPIPLAAALLALLIADRGRRRLCLGRMAIFVAVAALVLSPLAYYWWTHPGSFMTRTGQVWDGILDCLGMFFVKGDPYIRFNIPLRPIFDPILAVLFVLGIGVIILQVCKFASLQGRGGSFASLHLASGIFFLIFLPVMLLPSALAAGEITPSNLRAVGLLPFVYVFPALGLSVLARFGCRFVRWRYLSFDVCHLIFAILVLVVFIPITAGAYFGDWAVSPALYYEADGDMADAAAYLNRADLGNTTPYVASVYDRHPTLALLADDYDGVHWLAGGRTVVFPAAKDALLILPRSAAGDVAWVESVLPDNTGSYTGLGPDDEPAFYAYRISAGSAPAPTRPLDADFSHIVQILGYDVVEQARSGDEVEIAVWWRVLNGSPVDDYRPIARLADPWGHVWGETLPFHYVSQEWTPGEVVVDHLSIPVAPGAPPGEYLVRFGFYAESADQRLAVLDAAGRYASTYIELPVRLERAVEPASPGDLDIHNRLGVHFDGLTLLGADLDTRTVRPGEPLFLTLFWRAGEAALSDRDVALVLGDVMLYRGTPVHDTYPFSDWGIGEVIADRYGPRLPRDVEAGAYALQLQVGSQPVDLGSVTVQATERVFDVPSVAHPLAANLGDQVELFGYDLLAGEAAPGDVLTLTLYWKALAEMDESYTVFTHLVTPDGAISGQRDNPPVGGSYPTNLWLSGEVIVDVYEISIAAGAAPGEHTLEVGMYVAETGARLPIVGGSTDAVILQTITITK